jgi:hypothetical protein
MPQARKELIRVQKIDGISTLNRELDPTLSWHLASNLNEDVRRRMNVPIGEAPEAALQ